MSFTNTKVVIVVQLGFKTRVYLVPGIVFQFPTQEFDIDHARRPAKKDQNVCEQ